MQEKLRKLKAELDKVRSQLYVFYELNKAMRTTLRLDEITYIILTGLTARQGLGFNRAAIFIIDQENKELQGYMGIGPINGEEAGRIWQNIEEKQKNLYDLIDNYRQIKEKKHLPKFMEFIRDLSFPLNQSSGLIYDVLNRKKPIHLKTDEKDRLISDPLIKKLKLSEFIISPLKIKGKSAGVIIVDNYITKKPMTADDLKVFSMFIDQSQGAIENSRHFENTLTAAHTDSLTKLWNHGYFQYRLDEEILEAERSNTPLSLIMLDIDDFKKFNDAHGHIKGDKALKLISRVLKENCRKIDIVCRYGGEEFALILPANNKNDSRLLAERIQRSIEKNTIMESQFTVSIGIATYSQGSRNKETLIHKADQALYRVKNNGKNGVIAA